MSLCSEGYDVNTVLCNRCAKLYTENLDAQSCQKCPESKSLAVLQVRPCNIPGNIPRCSPRTSTLRPARSALPGGGYDGATHSAAAVL
eukprot:563182-Prorocentrum_minimum.AAC.3